MYKLYINNIKNNCNVLNLNEFYYKFIVKGRYGNFTKYIKKDFIINIKENSILLSLKNKKDALNNLLKTLQMSIKTIIYDLNYSFYVVLEIRGVGYYVEEDKKGVLNFHIGYSHSIKYFLRDGVAFKKLNDKGTLFTIIGLSRSDVFLTLFDLLNMRKKDQYKGKGIFYYSETIKLKKGKSQKK